MANGRINLNGIFSWCAVGVVVYFGYSTYVSHEKKVADEDATRARTYEQSITQVALEEASRKQKEAEENLRIARLEAEKKQEQHFEEKRKADDALRLEAERIKAPAIPEQAQANFNCPKCNDTGMVEGKESFDQKQRAEYECQQRNETEWKERETTREEIYAKILSSNSSFAAELRNILRFETVFTTYWPRFPDYKASWGYFHGIYQDQVGMLAPWESYQRKDKSYGIKRWGESERREYCTCPMAKQKATQDYNQKVKDAIELDAKRQKLRENWTLLANKLNGTYVNMAQLDGTIKHLHEVHADQQAMQAATQNSGGSVITMGDMRPEMEKLNVKTQNISKERAGLQVLIPNAFNEWMDAERTYAIRKQLSDHARKAMLLLGNADNHGPKGHLRYTLSLKDGTEQGAVTYMKTYNDKESKWVYAITDEDGMMSKIPAADVAEIVDSQATKASLRYAFTLKNGDTMGVAIFFRANDAYSVRLEDNKLVNVPVDDVAEILDTKTGKKTVVGK